MNSFSDEGHLLASLVQERLFVRRAVGEQRAAVLQSAEEQAAAKRRWREAVVARAAHAHQSEVVAERAVLSMLNQMVDLAQGVAWWEAHGAAAMAETVKYARGDLTVDSAPAQRAWDRYWTEYSSLGSFARELNPSEVRQLTALTKRMDEARALWRGAWNDWQAARS